MMGKIELKGMHFFARHGVYEQERIDGNDFLVDFSCDADISAASVSDNLDDTIDYQLIHSIVAEEMDIPSSLLEHVAGRILRRIRAEIPELLHASVSISKMNPPLPTATECSKVTLSY